MEALCRLKAQGKIRSIGVSNFGGGDVTTIVQYGVVDSNQVPYSLFWRAIEASIVDACMREDIGIICYSPLGQGLLTGKFKKRADIPEGNRTRTRLYADEALALAFPALEQLRALENGFKIRVLESPFDSIEVDVPEDIGKIEEALPGSSFES